MEYNSKAYALLRWGHKLHFQEVMKYLNPRKGEKVLEIGCAGGTVVQALQGVVPATYGIDVNPTAIQHGITRNLACMSAENMQFEDGSFDKIYSFHTIEHIPNIKNVLHEVSRVLRPGGKVLLVYPAEPIRGLFSIAASFIMFKHPFKARQIHVHKLNPGKMRHLIEGTALVHVESGFSLRKGPEFFTVLRKQV